MSNTTFTITAEIINELFVDIGTGENFTGKRTHVRLKDIFTAHPHLVNDFIIAAVEGTLNNVSRGKDENGKPNSDDVWASARAKRTDCWYQGTFGSRAAGKGDNGELAQAYAQWKFERMASGKTEGQARAMIKAKVEAVLPKGEQATFANFLRAVATERAKADKVKADAMAEYVEAFATSTIAPLVERYAARMAESPVTADDLGL